ncbi:hypothetical protein V6N11_000846 [Hibiscus sabdariffa]|uniref:Phorbol-ester/DAG-type domain-containing protein n=1 Tax=Hibiscus sabdariffa TaxID=183260 RepID=A0ABR2RXY2_9ROSI
MEIQRAIHSHPLSIFDNGDENIFCHRCWRRSSGPTYGCRKCGIFFHKDCIDELKPEVQCFFHPCPLVLLASLYRFCPACEEIIVGLGYGCKLSCDFYVHEECALKAMAEYSDEEHSIPHFTHLHPLKPVDLSQQKDVLVTGGRGYVCAICEKLCSSPTYGCMKCKFFLDKSCMTSVPARLTNHLIHPCTLVIRYYSSYNCAKCDKKKWFILAFSCEPCGFHLDVKCALLSNAECEEATEIKHLSHPHPLSLIQNHQEYGNQPRCVACEQKCLPPTPTFRCSSKSSSCAHFFLHKSCAVNFPRQPLLLHHHPCHPKHKLTITTLPTCNDRVPVPTCGACCWGIDTDSSLFAYRCSTDQCEFILHLDCGKLSPSFDCDGHRHLLTFLERTPGFPCHACGANCSTFVLRCVPCNFNIHLQCVPSAPKTITHKSHLHPLVLTKSPFQHELNSEEDAYNSEDEFYCDVCEDKRYKREPVYYCADCKFIAELKCVISEVLPSIPRSTFLIQQVDATDYNDRNGDDDVDDSRWEISKVLYKIKNLEQTKNELEKRLELATRDLQQAKNMFQKLVADAHK